MTRVRHIAALSAACLLIALGAPRADAEPTVRNDAPGSITAVSVTPGTGRAEVVIAVEGPIDLFDFTLESPRRIVVDLRGATLGVPARLYDKVSRGGITNVRLAQYKPGVVRVVLDLDGDHEYTVVRGEKDVRISVAGPDRFATWSLGARPAVAPPAAPAAPAPQQSPERRITVSFQETHIRDVITSFAQFSGRTIVVGRQVDGFVTADIKNQPWDLALKSILASQGLSLVVEPSGIITVDSYANIADKQRVEPVQTQVIQVNYAKAETMAATVRQLLGAGCGGGAPKAAVSEVVTGTSGAGSGAGGSSATGATASPGVGASCSSRGVVSFDEKTNAVIVTETPGRLADIANYIRDLDVRTPQVAIKAKIIAVDRTGTEQLGISYDLGSANTFSNAVLAGVTGSYTIQFTATAYASVTSNTVTLSAGSPAKIAWSGPDTAVTNAVTEPLTITLQDSTGNTAVSAGTTTLNLSNNGSGTFYSDAAGTSVITSINVTNGNSTATVYYKETVGSATTRTLTAAATGLTSGTHSLYIKSASTASQRLACVTNGKGGGAIKALDGSAVVLNSDAGKQIHVLLNGQNNAMPAWKQLSDTDIAAVISYTKNNWSNKTGQLVQPADVKAAR